MACFFFASHYYYVMWCLTSSLSLSMVRLEIESDNVMKNWSLVLCMLRNTNGQSSNVCDRLFGHTGHLPYWKDCCWMCWHGRKQIPHDAQLVLIGESGQCSRNNCGKFFPYRCSASPSPISVCHEWWLKKKHYCLVHAGENATAA